MKINVLQIYKYFLLTLVFSIVFFSFYKVFAYGTSSSYVRTPNANVFVGDTYRIQYQMDAYSTSDYSSIKTVLVSSDGTHNVSTCSVITAPTFTFDHIFNMSNVADYTAVQAWFSFDGTCTDLDVSNFLEYSSGDVIFQVLPGWPAPDLATSDETLETTKLSIQFAVLLFYYLSITLSTVYLINKVN